MTALTGADIMVKCLEAEGIEIVFGYPGVAIAPFFDSLYKSDINGVLVRSEQNAAHSASGYCRAGNTEKPGVCAVTSGPGATNLITGIATAYADSIPLVCISGQVNSELLGSDVFQEADITGACESFVKYSYLVKNVEDIPRVFREAFHIASTGRKGPVLIDIPIDVQQATVKAFKYPENVEMRTYRPTVRGNMIQLKRLVTELKNCSRPVICAGGGVILSKGRRELLEFAEKHGIPVVTTMMGMGVIPTNHPLCFGMVGNNGKNYANRAIKESDLIILVGARVADRAVSKPDIITKNTVVVHIDVDPAEIGKNAGYNVPIVGDVRTVFEDLADMVFDVDYGDWLQVLNSYKELYRPVQNPVELVNPGEFVRKLSEAMEKDSIYVADVGQNQLWSCGNIVIKEGKFFTTCGMGTMGYALPAAIGAKLKRPERQVVAVCGDGAFQMSLCELATARACGVTVKIVVISNGYLGLVREYQHYNLNDRYSMVDLSGNPDLSYLSQAYGLEYYMIDKNQGMEDIIGEFLSSEGSGLLEVKVSYQATVV